MLLAPKKHSLLGNCEARGRDTAVDYFGSGDIGLCRSHAGAFELATG
jgi:hypothetical protein